jgi:hypothetical protein
MAVNKSFSESRSSASELPYQDLVRPATTLPRSLNITPLLILIPLSFFISRSLLQK